MDTPVHRGEHRPASLYELDRPSLEALVVDLGQPRYRADQLWHWLYRRAAATFDEMHNLPAAFREQLGQRIGLRTVQPVAVTSSGDSQAVKILFRLADGQLIETVLMHYEDPADADAPADARDHDRHEHRAVSEVGRSLADDTGRPSGASAGRGVDEPHGGRRTVCLSSQAGCAMGCSFCATGQMGLVRDLTAGEIVQQAVHCARYLIDKRLRLTNAVFMGMGEPLANWPPTWQAIEVLTDADGFGIGARRITVSTVGIVPGIDRLASCGKPVRLAVSLHASDDMLRNQLVAVNETYSLTDVLAACRRYQAAGGRRITFEYVLIRGVNDKTDHAVALAHRLRGLIAHVNLIPLNPTAGSPMKPSGRDAVLAFKRALEENGVTTSARLRRGIDIDAGCGQLRSRAEDGLVGRTIRPPVNS